MSNVELKVVGSSSKGNCYVLEAEDDALVIDCGCSYADIKRAMDFKVSKIKGIIVTHSHKDHCRYLDKLRKYYPSFTPYKDEDMAKQERMFGQFRVKAFKLEHDVTCYGFLIKHPDMGTLVYATDTELIPYTFPNINHFLVEANYSLDDISSDYRAYEHVLKGHQSIEACCKFLKNHDIDDVHTVILCHLSDENGKDDVFVEEVKKQFEIAKPFVMVAKPQISVELSTTAVERF